MEEALAVALAEGCDWVCGCVRHLFEGAAADIDGLSGRYWVEDDPDCLTSAKMQMLGNLEYKHSRLPNYQGRGPIAKLYRRDKLTELRFDENITLSEDVLFNYRYIELCGSISVVDRCWYLYYQYYNSSSHTVDIENWASSIDGLMDACADNEDDTAFISCSAVMLGRAMEMLLGSSPIGEAYSQGKELFRRIDRKGCFSNNLFEGYLLSPWMQVFGTLCKNRWYSLLFAWCAVKSLKNKLIRRSLIKGDESL